MIVPLLMRGRERFTRISHLKERRSFTPALRIALFLDREYFMVVPEHTSEVPLMLRVTLCWFVVYENTLRGIVEQFPLGASAGLRSGALLL